MTVNAVGQNNIQPSYSVYNLLKHAGCKSARLGNFGRFSASKCTFGLYF